MPIELIKTLHVLGAVLFLGNIIVAAVWKALADRSGNATIIAHSQRLVTITDFAFTLTGVVLLAVTGPIMATRLGIQRASWVIWGEALFGLAGIVWLAVEIPVQILQARVIRGIGPSADIPMRYWRLARVWMLGGSIATVLPLAVLVLMVIKPG